MDTLRGQFDPADFSEELQDYDLAEDEGAPEPPPSPIGQDERRMQVRAYNHWAGLLGDRAFPSIEDLEPETLDDFGPYSVLLDFSNGIEDPHVRFVGTELAGECDIVEGIEQLSDVPSRSLLSRITDHYMQILANQAPIGFEAEFLNQRERTILYRGILLPYSSDNDTIDFIFGVINWKEVADQQTTDELLLEIDQALEGAPAPVGASDNDDNVLDLSSYSNREPEAQEDDAGVLEPRLTRPSFASLLTPEGFDEEDEDEDDFSLPANWRLSDPTAETDGDYADDSADVYDEDFDPETDGEDDEEGGIELGLSRLIESEFERAERAERKPIDLAALDIAQDAIDPDAAGYTTREFDFGTGGEADPFAIAAQDEPVAEAEDAAIGAEPFEEETFEEESLDEEAFENDYAEPGEFEDIDLDDPISGTAEPADHAEAFDPEIPLTMAPMPIGMETPAADSEVAGEEISEDDAPIALEPEDPDADGLYDALADARELAQVAQHSEDRSRTALYAAVGRAYDVSLAAQDAPDDFAELLDESGLTVQDRAPMTPVVKLVFGAEYDKTRLTEYAAALSYAHRLGIARGKLGSFLYEAEGGLKGVVREERRMRREEAGKPVETRTAPREALAKKLRAIDGIDLADIPVDGEEFALVMIRRTPEGDIVVLGEIADDVPLIERAARKILG